MANKQRSIRVDTVSIISIIMKARGTFHSVLFCSILTLLLVVSSSNLLAETLLGNSGNGPFHGSSIQLTIPLKFLILL